MPTTSTSHRSRYTLQQVATSHANSRALSTTTRNVFRDIATGLVFDTTDLDDHLRLEDAFFEAATSCATRAGQSYSRRVMTSDLMALREAVTRGESVIPSDYVLQVVVTAHDAADVDTFERALRAFKHDGVTVTSVEGV